MKCFVNRLKPHLPYLLAIAAAHLLIYRNYWLLKLLFTGGDFHRWEAPAVNFQADCFAAGSWPLWNPFVNFGYPWTDFFGSSFLFPTHAAFSVIFGYCVKTAQLEILCWQIAGGLGMYFCAQAFGISKRASALCAFSFLFSGQMDALPAWNQLVYNTACFPFMLWGYRLSLGTEKPFSLLAAIFLALSFLGGYAASAVIGAYFFAGFALVDSALRKKPLWGMKFVFFTALLAAALALPKLLPIYLSQGAVPRLAVTPQWRPELGIITAHEFVSFLLPVKHFFSLYCGELTLLAVFFALIARRKTGRNISFLIMFAAGAWFLLVNGRGDPSFLKTVLRGVLPFVKQVRMDFLYWAYPLAFLSLYAAGFFEDFLESAGDKYARGAAALFGIMCAVLFVIFFDARNASGFLLFHIAIAAAWLGITLIKKRRLQTLAALALLCLEMGIVFERNRVDMPYSDNGRELRVLMTHQNFADRSFRSASLAGQAGWVTYENDAVRPGLSAAVDEPVLHIGKFEAGAVINALNNKKFTATWLNSQERRGFMLLKAQPWFSRLEGAPLFEFRGNAGDGNAAVSFNRLTGSEFAFTVKSAKGGLLVLRQMFDGRWDAVIDGARGPAQVCDNFFMQARVPPGKHQVKFVFRDYVFLYSLLASIFALTLSVFLSVCPFHEP